MADVKKNLKEGTTHRFLLLRSGDSNTLLLNNLSSALSSAHFLGPAKASNGILTLHIMYIANLDSDFSTLIVGSPRHNDATY